MFGWKVITHARSDRKFPLLLIKFELDGLSYVTRLTDLSHIWSETMDRKAIARRALNDDVSIDILAGEEQCKKLLDYVGKAIEGAPNTLMDITSDGDLEAVTIKLTADLPQPLEPLVWNMNLARAPTSLITSEIVVPSLHMLSRERSNMTSLTEIIRDKDIVLNKLLDALEQNGVDLTAVFPSAVSRHSKLSRQNLQQHVPALEPFDASRWREKLPDKAEPSLQEICRLVFKDDLDSKQVPTENGVSSSSIDKGLRADARLDPRLSKNEAMRPTSAKQEDELFKMTTIQQSKRNGKLPISPGNQSSASETASETASEPGVFEDPPATKIEADSLEPLSSPPKKRLGTLGGTHHKASLRIANTDARTGDQHAKTEPATKGEMRDVTPPKPRGKLGRLGGKRTTPNSADQKPDEGTRNDLLPSREKTMATDIERLSRRSRPSAEEDVQRETSKEMADRKRVELKREMEEKRKAPPKKKRKF